MSPNPELNLWFELREHFDTDDGSLPDIFVDNLSSAQIIEVYNWVCSISGLAGEPTLWDKVMGDNIPIKSIDDPAGYVVKKRSYTFRHALYKLSISGIVIPQLTIGVFPYRIEFDYRMGNEWGPKTLTALFEFLWSIQEIAPAAVIRHFHEGQYENPTKSFTDTWLRFKQLKLTSRFEH